MMKRKTQLIILILVLALLGGGYAFLSSRPQEEPVAQPVVDEAYEILSVPSGNVEEMSWVCSGCDDVCSFRNLGEIWEYIPDPSRQLDNDYLNLLVGIFSTFNAYRELEMPEDPSVYGLDDPYASVTLKTIEGDEYVINFGNATSVPGRRYCAIGDGKVYVVSGSAATSFSYDLNKIVNLGE